MSHAPPFGCNEYPPGGARPDEEAFVSTEQQSPKHTIFLQRNSKVGVELSMAIVIEGYVNIAGKRSNCEFPAYPGVPGRFYEVIMPDAFKTSLLQTTCIKLKVDHTRVIGSTHTGCIRGWSFAFIAEQSEWYRLDPREKLYYRKVKRAKLLEVSLMIEKDAAYSGTTVNVKNVEEEKPWSFMKLKEILRP